MRAGSAISRCLQVGGVQVFAHAHRGRAEHAAAGKDGEEIVGLAAGAGEFRPDDLLGLFGLRVPLQSVQVSIQAFFQGLKVVDILPGHHLGGARQAAGKFPHGLPEDFDQLLLFRPFRKKVGNAPADTDDLQNLQFVFHRGGFHVRLCRQTGDQPFRVVPLDGEIEQVLAGLLDG